MGSKLRMLGINSLIRHVPRLGEEEEEIEGDVEEEEWKLWEAFNKVELLSPIKSSSDYFGSARVIEHSKISLYNNRESLWMSLYFSLFCITTASTWA